MSAPWNMASVRARTYRARKRTSPKPLGACLPLLDEGSARLTCEHGHIECRRCRAVYMPGSMSIDRPRTLDRDRVEFDYMVEQDDSSIRGNASDYDDDEENEALAVSIEERLERGDVWAWCWVKITARYTDEVHGELVVDSAIGGCSYADQDEFDACYGNEIKEQLIRELEELIA